MADIGRGLGHGSWMAMDVGGGVEAPWANGNLLTRLGWPDGDVAVRLQRWRGAKGQTRRGRGELRKDETRGGTEDEMRERALMCVSPRRDDALVRSATAIAST